MIRERGVRTTRRLARRAVGGEREASPLIDLAGATPTVDLRASAARELARPFDFADRAQLLRAPRWKLVIKRGIDVVGSVSLLLLLAPVMLTAAVAVGVTSRGPVIFRQDRVGQAGALFSMFKFRTMHVDAEHRRNEVLDLNEHSGPIFKARHDPRITRVGRLLRRMSIDETPQLLHVLSGRMSLVGPRPALPKETELYTPYQWQRLYAKPGLTCIWQVSGRSTIDFDTWVEMDLDYIERWNLTSDLRLLWSTVPAVLSGKGAF